MSRPLVFHINRTSKNRDFYVLKRTQMKKFVFQNRLNVDLLGGAWCPKGMVGTEDQRDYLEIDLRDLHVVSAVETQGRFGNGRGVEYVEYFLLEYWRFGFQRWRTYKLYNGSKVRSRTFC